MTHVTHDDTHDDTCFSQSSSLLRHASLNFADLRFRSTFSQSAGQMSHLSCKCGNWMCKVAKELQYLCNSLKELQNLQKLLKVMLGTCENVMHMAHALCCATPCLGFAHVSQGFSSDRGLCGSQLFAEPSSFAQISYTLL